MRGDLDSRTSLAHVNRREVLFQNPCKSLRHPNVAPHHGPATRRETLGRRRRRSLSPAVPGEVKDESGRSLFRFRRRRRRRRKPSFLPFYSAGGEEEEQFIRNQEEEDSHWERRQKEEKKVRLMSCGDVLSRG